VPKSSCPVPRVEHRWDLVFVVLCVCFILFYSVLSFLFCSFLFCSILFYSVLFDSVFCFFLFFSVLLCSILSIPFYSVLSDSVLFCSLFCSILFYCVLFCSAILSCAILFYSDLLCSILFILLYSVFSVLFCSIMFHSILFFPVLLCSFCHSILLCSILLNSVLFDSVLFYSVLFHSILFYYCSYSVLFSSILFYLTVIGKKLNFSELGDCFIEISIFSLGTEHETSWHAPTALPPPTSSKIALKVAIPRTRTIVCLANLSTTNSKKSPGKTSTNCRNRAKTWTSNSQNCQTIPRRLRPRQNCVFAEDNEREYRKRWWQDQILKGNVYFWMFFFEKKFSCNENTEIPFGQESFYEVFYDVPLIFIHGQPTLLKIKLKKVRKLRSEYL
jgi:hypothetical protein